jgi:hypothetical protein
MTSILLCVNDEPINESEEDDRDVFYRKWEDRLRLKEIELQDKEKRLKKIKKDIKRDKQKLKERESELDMRSKQKEKRGREEKLILRTASSSSSSIQELLYIHKIIKLQKIVRRWLFRKKFHEIGTSRCFFTCQL